MDFNMDIAQLKIGAKVHYRHEDWAKNKWQNGIVKEIPENSVTDVRVVFHCAGDWKNFKEYTAQLTPLKDLTQGWRHDEEESE